MTPEEEGKEKALRNYRILAVVLVILGATLLILGIVSVVKEKENDKDTFGPPFYVGGFVVGIMALASACLCVCVFTKATTADSDVKKRMLACAIQGHYCLSGFMILGCFAGTVLAGVGGFVLPSLLDEEKDEYYYVKQKYAAAILALCIISLVVTICSMCTVCAYGPYFGVIIRTHKGRARVIYRSNNYTGNAIITQPQTFESDQTNAAGFGMGSASNDQRGQLEEQNRLLQDQLELQRQLHQNQNLQQNQYSGGFYPAQPTNYGFNGVPSAHPPSYDSVQ